MEKLYTSKKFLRKAGGWMHIEYPSSYPPGSPLAISYRNHQKSMAYFSHLAPLVFFFFLLKGRVIRGWVGMAQCSPKYAPASSSLRLGACKRIISSFKRGC